MLRRTLLVPPCEHCPLTAKKHTRESAMMTERCGLLFALAHASWEISTY
jgi:hypothetical protein